MRLEFNQGVPVECVDWLWDNVGSGNLMLEKHKHITFSKYAWFYERIEVVGQVAGYGNYRYIPTITVDDSALATLFILRWA